jgi:hypothetical protein
MAAFMALAYLRGERMEFKRIFNANAEQIQGQGCGCCRARL